MGGARVLVAVAALLLTTTSSYAAPPRSDGLAAAIREAAADHRCGAALVLLSRLEDIDILAARPLRDDPAVAACAAAHRREPRSGKSAAIPELLTVGGALVGVVTVAVGQWRESVPAFGVGLALSAVLPWSGPLSSGRVWSEGLPLRVVGAATYAGSLLLAILCEGTEQAAEHREEPDCSDPRMAMAVGALVYSAGVVSDAMMLRSPLGARGRRKGVPVVTSGPPGTFGVGVALAW